MMVGCNAALLSRGGCIDSGRVDRRYSRIIFAVVASRGKARHRLNASALSAFASVVCRSSAASKGNIMRSCSACHASSTAKKLMLDLCLHVQPTLQRLT